MPVTRRTALMLLGGLAFAPVPACAGDEEALVYLSAYKDANHRFGVAVLDGKGRTLLQLALPQRGHGVVVRPASTQAIVFARRPGTFALVFDYITGGRVAIIHANADRHFYGHGAFSADGRLLYASENDVAGERGIVGIYDAYDSYRHIGEYDSYGVGPHELILMPDDRTLAIANGGILTHPDYPRLKLNLAEMRPSITFVDRHTGDLRRDVQAPKELYQLSLRHIAVNGDGLLAVAGQWEGADTELPPLVGLLGANEPMRLLSAPRSIQIAMQHYCGSVAFSNNGNNFAVSAPRGDIITYWSADGRFERSVRLRDGCGLAPHASGFLVSAGDGRIVDHDNTVSRHPLAWDNHLTFAATARASGPGDEPGAGEEADQDG